MSVNQVNGNIERARAAMAATAIRGKSAYAATSASAPVRQPDAVSLSEEAKSLAAAQQAVASTPDVRADRVEAIKTSIANGTYSVDSRTLALAMTKAGAI